MTTPNILTATALKPGQLNTPALLASGETTVYTVPTNKAIKLATAAITNTSSLAVVISVSIVPLGGTASSVNRVVSGYSLAPGDTLSQEEIAAFNGTMLADGQFISVNAGTASAVTVNLSGTLIEGPA